MSEKCFCLSDSLRGYNATRYFKLFINGWVNSKCHVYNAAIIIYIEGKINCTCHEKNIIIMIKCSRLGKSGKIMSYNTIFSETFKSLEIDNSLSVKSI